MIKHPFIWGGVGLVIRYHDGTSTKAMVYKTLGVLSVAVGIGHALMTHRTDR
jgi:glucose uptake protein GlcU